MLEDEIYSKCCFWEEYKSLNLSEDEQVNVGGWNTLQMLFVERNIKTLHLREDEQLNVGGWNTLQMLFLEQNNREFWQIVTSRIISSENL